MLTSLKRREIGNGIESLCSLTIALRSALRILSRLQTLCFLQSGRRDWLADSFRGKLEKRGYRVLRFPNGIVLQAPTEFVKKIQEYMAQLEQVRLNELRQ